MRLALIATITGIGGAALALTGGANAQSYEWSPQKTSTNLTGKLTFVPDEGNGASFQCKVSLSFHTGNVKRGEDALPQFISGVVKGRGCENVSFYSLPWYAGAIASPGVNGPNGIARLSVYGWRGGIEGCTGNGGVFHVTPDGTKWLFDGAGCFAGTLTANPPVTIVPVP